MLLLIFAAYVNIGHAACNIGPFKNIQLTVQSTTNALKEVYASDIAGFCRDNVIGDFQRPIEPSIDGNDMAKQVAALQKEHPSASEAELRGMVRMDGGPWIDSINPDEKVRLDAFKYGFPVQSKDAPTTIDDYKKILQDPHEQKILNEAPKGLSLTFDQIEQDSTFDTDLVNSHVAGVAPYGICLFTEPIHDVSCGNGLKNIARVMAPRTDHLTLVPVLKDVLTNQEYRKGLTGAAMKILNKVEAGGQPSGNVFDDIKSSFMESGLSDQKAEDFTWNVLGVIATSGANIAFRILPIEGDDGSLGAKAALEAIALSMGVLDSRTAKTAHLYSYPPTIGTTCDYGKSYDFWMAAYLARMNVKEGGTVEGSAAAAFVTEKGYEMLSNTAGRDPSRPFRVTSLDATNNVMRMDMAFAGAGAVYGANRAKEKTISLDVDDGIRTLIFNAGDVNPLPPEAANNLWLRSFGLDGFFRWQSIFNPDSVFHRYLESAD